jgi:hypothetical protein
MTLCPEEPGSGYSDFLHCQVVAHPRAERLRLPCSCRFLDYRDFHEFTPCGLIGRSAVYILALAAVRCAKLTNADSNAPR